MVGELPDAPSAKKLPIAIPLSTKLKVKNLYLFQDAPHERIAKETGLTVKAVGDVIHREGWPKIRRERERKLTEKSDARGEQADLVIVEAIGSQAEEIALSGLERARDAVKRKGKDAAKNFQSWTGGIRNLVSAIKTIRARDGSMPDSEPRNLNLFFVGLPGAAPMPEPKPVTEISATKV